MTPSDWHRVTDIFGEALASLDSKDATEQILAREPEEVRREVRRLLASHQSLEAWTPRSGAESRARRQPGGILAGRYRLVHLLGAGGNGEAWLSCDFAAENRQVVVKVPHAWEWFRNDVKRRFLAECEVLRRISHPSIVTVLDSGESEDGAPFLVMPFIDGQSLRSLLEMQALPARVAATISEALGSAIQAAHASGVVHRDLKPENVLIEMPDREPRVFLIDFGIAMFGELEQHSSTTTRFFGTTQYMAPEQLLGQPGPPSDLYALALLVYEMVAGEPLFEAAAPAALYEQQRKLRESDFNAAIYGSLRSLLWSALCPDPRRRPRDAGEFGRRVAAALRNPKRQYLPSRRAVLSAALVAAPAAGWTAWNYRPVSGVEKKIDYQGGQTFRDLGWKTMGVIDLDIVEMDSKRERYNGNRLLSRSQGGYFHSLSRPAQRRALNYGWKLSALLRPIHGFIDIGLVLQDFGIRFSASLVTPDRGAPYLRALRSVYPAIEAITRPVELSNQVDLVPVEIRYDSGRQEASVYLRGEKVIDRYSGCRQYLGVPGVTLVVGQSGSEVGEGVVGDIHFAMG